MASRISIRHGSGRSVKRTFGSRLVSAGAAPFVALSALLVFPPATAQSDVVLIDRGTSMRYLANSVDPGLGNTWTQSGFDDSSWTPGVYGIGYENQPPGALGLIDTLVPNTSLSVYTRLSVYVDDTGAVTNVFVGADFDDAYAVWINGDEVFRSSGLPTGPLDWNTPGGDHESSNNGIAHYEFSDITGPALGALVTGDNDVAIAVYNRNSTSADLVLVPNLTLNKTTSLTRGPYLQKGSSDSITVCWRTNVPTDSRVLCGASPGSLSLCAQDLTLVQDHEIELTALSPDTTYYYAIGDSSQLFAGDDAEHRFITAPLTGVSRPTRVWILGDPGMGNQDAMDVRDAYYNAVGNDPTHLWLLLGDNAYDSGTDGEYQVKFFDIYGQMLIQSVLWPSLGNHDSTTANSITQTGPYFEIFALPVSGEAGGLGSGTEAYYSFDYGNIHFVVLDSTDTPRTPGSPMLVWLANDLAATAQDWIIAYWHHPPYSKGSHDSDTETPLMEMRQYVVPILDDYGVDLTFTGHSHDYERSFPIEGHYDVSATFDSSMMTATGDGNPTGDGPYVKPVAGPDPHSGIVHTVAGNASQITGGTLDHPAMYVSLNVLGSVVLDVNGNRLDVGLLDKNGAILDRFRILKGSTLSLPIAGFTLAPESGPAPLVVDFTDTTQNSPTAWSWDFENDSTVDSTAQNPMHTYPQPGLYDVRLGASNTAGSDELLKTGAVCVYTPAPTRTSGLVFHVWDDIVFWDASPGVTGYDVIRGNLNQLRSNGGDFGNAQAACLINDTTELSATDGAIPGSGEALFYLVRTADCSHRTGSFDADGPSQAGSRDLQLQGAAGTCACENNDDPDTDNFCGAFDTCTDSDADTFGDPGFPANLCPEDNCPAVNNPAQADDDMDGAGNACDDCPFDTLKVDPGVCGCGMPDEDLDLDGWIDCVDPCLDADGDGYGIDGGGGSCLDTDCNDADPGVHPGAAEIGCDGIDNDCDALTPDLVDLDSDSFTCDVDCNDGVFDINPGVPEVGCDTVDNDCNVTTPDILDGDSDSFTCDVDCNDADAAIHPGAPEIGCDAIDNDCNAGTPDILDGDSDGFTCDVDCNDQISFINPGETEIGCDGLDNDCDFGTPDLADADTDLYTCDVDCNDNNAAIHPGAAEVGCDSIDNDCNVATPDILDGDGDTYACDSDCNDWNSAIHPGAAELGCDGLNNDCDATTPDILDGDGDTFTCDVDCDDANTDVNPGEIEISCDGIDNDCSPSTPDIVDMDSDGFSCTFDCNDADPAIHPGQSEIGCDGIDNDCSGGTADVFDVDGDGFACDVDCDETSIHALFTFPGAAPNDDPVACMTDRDDDDWGRITVVPGVTPGTDCDDTDAARPPGC